MGAVIKAGTSPEQPLKFILPEHDFTYHTKNFHPMRLEVFENLEEVVSHVKQPDEIKSTGGKRKRSNWFILDAHEKKYLKHDSSDEPHSRRKSTASASSSAEVAEAADAAAAMDTTSEDDAPMGRVGKVKRMKRSKEVEEELEEEPKKEKRTHKAQKWKVRVSLSLLILVHFDVHKLHSPLPLQEKEIFYDALDKHGHDWTEISGALGTRTPTQVKNYYYDNKKTITKAREKMAKTKAAALAAEQGDTIGKKKKKTKRGKKATIKEGEQNDDTPKSLTPTTDDYDSSVVDTSGASTRGSYSEAELQNPNSGLMELQANIDQEEQYRQQLRLHQQDQLRQQILQQHLQQQAAQQRQEELYRQQMQQEEVSLSILHNLSYISNAKFANNESLKYSFVFLDVSTAH